MGGIVSRRNDSNTKKFASYCNPSANDFDFGVVLGEGGFGKVHFAVRYVDDSKWAVKVMSKEKILSKRNVGQVFNERKILLLINPTPWIVGLTQAFQDEFNLYMVTELAQHGDLRSLLQRHPDRKLELNTAKFYIVCCLWALDNLHSTAGIVHRDVKPDNILIKADGYAALGDLGIAKELDKDGLVHGRSGTSSYMPLEAFQPPFATTTGTDVFALGVTFHELVNGRKPFERGAVRAFAKSGAPTSEINDDESSIILMSILRMSEPSTLPLIKSMIHLDPSKRISVKKALASPILACVTPLKIRSRRRKAPPVVGFGGSRRLQRRSQTMNSNRPTLQTASSFRHEDSDIGDPFFGFEFDPAFGSATAIEMINRQQSKMKGEATTILHLNEKTRY